MLSYTIIYSGWQLIFVVVNPATTPFGCLKCSSKFIIRSLGSSLWLNRETRLFSIGLSHDFVMRAILAFSASHLAFVTCNKDTLGIAYYHRDYALKGLQGAINTFSNNNYEAVLAASVLLSWQATEW